MMNGKEDRVNSFLTNLVIKRKSKDLSHSRKTVFCNAGKSLIICHGKSCHLYNTSTGNHLKQLFKSQSNIISHQLHPLNELLVIGVTENGEVTVYNLESNQVEHTTQLKLDAGILQMKEISKFRTENVDKKEFDWDGEMVNSLVHRKFLHAETKAFNGNHSKVLIWTSWCLNDEIYAHVSVFALEDGKHKKSFALRKTRLKKSPFNFILSKGQETDFFVGLSNNCIDVVHFEEKNSYFYTARKHYTGLNSTLTCLAIHPTEYCIATGDSIGRITLWKNIFDRYPLKEIFHWHSTIVHDLIFSKYGNYIFSGGEECVLVKWSVTARKKQFLPRLSSAICYLSEGSESSLLSVLTSDSRILILDFNFHCISTIQSFSKWCTLKNMRPSSIFTIDPRSECIVLNGKTGHIQFLSIKEEGKLVYVFDVTHRNFIMNESKKSLSNTEVTHAVFSHTGEWLITAESRKETSCGESRLKFWKYASDKGSYALNTNIEFPHEGIEIYSLEISSDNVVATTGPDKKFKLWSLSEYPFGNVVKEIWSLYGGRKYRHNSCYAIDFSKDGSLVAVTFSSILTVWETSDCLLKCSLSSPSNKEPLKVCKFGNNEWTHLVVTGSEFTVCCWDTITLSVLWKVPLKLSILVSDPSSIYMAAFSKDQTLIVFNPSSPAPDLLLKEVCKSSVVAAQCGSIESGRFCLFFLNSDQDLFCLGGEEKVDEMGVFNEEQVGEPTPFVAQIPQIKARADVPEEKLIVLAKTNQRFATDLLNSPAHTLSNPSLLCCQILKALLHFSVNNRVKAPHHEAAEHEMKQIHPIEDENTVSEEVNETELLKLVKAIFV